MVERVECVVIGAGAVGLATARALARQGREVAILEAAETFGTGISARNSEVLHAGMYYAPGSAKARLCVAGAKRLRDYLAARRVTHRPVGKLIVATSAGEEEHLAALLARGQANGSPGLEMITAAAARALEPALTCRTALFSPHTGIFDSHALMLALLGDAEADGAQLAVRAPVTGGAVADRGMRLKVGGDDPCTLEARLVVNAAGLGAQRVARGLAGLPQERVPPLYLCKGNYFVPSGRMPFARLVYPVPGEAGLGVHYTVDLGGQGRFGPDTEWIEAETYTVDERRADVFYDAIRRYWPDLPDGALRPGYAGIRPKIQAPGEPARDFLISGPDDHGVAGLVNLFGIESPGLTACLAIADQVAELLS